MKTCPQCGNKMIFGTDGQQRVYACRPCGVVINAEVASTMPKLPGLDPGPQQNKIQELEAALVDRIERHLTFNGYTVIRVGQRIAKHSGNSPGAPDLFVTPKGRNDHKAIEIKLPGYCPSDVRPAQQRRIDAGEVEIATSEAEALAIMEGEAQA